jgi:hypothetical protein
MVTRPAHIPVSGALSFLPRKASAMTADLREALTAAGAAPLVPTIVDPMLLEYQRRYAPSCGPIPSRKWDSTVYYFNQRTARAAGGFVSDGGARPITNSTYQQNAFPIRNLQSVGAVTGYAQAVTKGLARDLKRQEIEGSIQGLYWDIENAILWGNSGSTQFGGYPQFDGLDSQVSTFSGSNQNALDAATRPCPLGWLDKLIDMVEQQAAMAIYGTAVDVRHVLHRRVEDRAARAAQQRFLNHDRGRRRPERDRLPGHPHHQELVPVRPLLRHGRRHHGDRHHRRHPRRSHVLLPDRPVIARQGEILPSTEVSQATTGSHQHGDPVVLHPRRPRRIPAQPVQGVPVHGHRHRDVPRLRRRRPSASPRTASPRSSPRASSTTAPSSPRRTAPPSPRRCPPPTSAPTLA